MITRDVVNDAVDELFNAQYQELASSPDQVAIVFLKTPKQQAVTAVINALMALDDALMTLGEFDPE